MTSTRKSGPGPALAHGGASHPGGRDYNEDRFLTAAVRTAGGLNLTVAMVADGVGGESRGERAAQLAIQVALATLQDSQELDRPRLVTAAMQAANTAVWAEARRMPAGQRMACTFVLALVDESRSLYLGNAGDSRAYLARGGRLRQLTRDHTVANLQALLGQAASAATRLPDGGAVLRALGVQPSLPVDLGLYLDTADYAVAERRGRAGLRLSSGDSVLLCTDGLIKPLASTGRPLLTEAAMADALQTAEGELAAQVLISQALGELPADEPADNITVAVVQPGLASRTRSWSAYDNAGRQRTRRTAIWVGAPLLAALLILGAAFAGFAQSAQSELAGVKAALAAATAEVAGQTATVAAFTATATAAPPSATLSSTPLPTRVPRELGRVYAGQLLAQRLTVAQGWVDVPPFETRLVEVGASRYAASGRLAVARGARYQLLAENEAQFMARFWPDTQAVVQSGAYPNGAWLEVAGGPVTVMVRGCLAFWAAPSGSVTVDCLAGDCALSADYGASFRAVTAGQSAAVTPDQTTASTAGWRPIDPGRLAAAWALARAVPRAPGLAAECQIPPPPAVTPTSLAPGTPDPLALPAVTPEPLVTATASP